MTKIKIGKKYKVNACIETVVHMTEERFATLDNTGCYSSWDYDEIDDWEEYVEPGIFEGIEVGDIVKVDRHSDVAVGFVDAIEAYKIFVMMFEDGNSMLSVSVDKANIKSITKLVPEVKK